VAFEPGRRTVILDRPAVAQLVRPMAGAFEARRTYDGRTPLYDARTRSPRIGQRVLDARLRIVSDPNDPDGGFLPFDTSGYPRTPMTFIEGGVLNHLAYDPEFAAKLGVTPANAPPESLRLEGAPTPGHSTVDDMIASCKEGIYVNRFSALIEAGSDPKTGMLSGVTQGGCFLVKNGKIEKPIKNLRFVESPWYAFNRILAIGTSERAGFGYAPWQGDWPVAPSIVPPLMISDFNFTAMADAI